MEENNMIKNKRKKSGDAKRRNKGEGTIRKKGNSYEGRVTIEVNGIKKQISLYDKDKRALIQKMNETINESNKNLYIANNDITVEEWLKKWVNIYKRGTVHNNTLRGYIIYIKNYILPEIGHYELQKIKPIHIQGIFQKMQNGQCETTNKKLSPKTIKETYNVLKMAFKTAMENDLIKSNCMDKIEPPKLRKKEPQIMTRKEQNEFEKMLLGKYGYTVFLFLLKTGERASEAAGTKWEDIDFENKTIKVINGLVVSTIYTEELEKKNNQLEDSDLKNDSSVRKIPMLFGIDKLLIEYREQYMKKNGIKTLEELKEKPLFLTNTGRRINSDFLWTKLDRFLKEAGFRHIGVHQLRHTFATRCLEAGITPKYLRKLLGHSTSMMTDRYTHLLNEFEMEENQKINQYYEESILLDNKEQNNKKIYKGQIKGKIKIRRKIA